MALMWTEGDDPIARAFDEAERAARPQRWVLTHRHHPCTLHTQPGPELWEDEGGTEHPVTDAMREQWKREGAFVVCEEYVDTCCDNGCDTATHGGLQV